MSGITHVAMDVPGRNKGEIVNKLIMVLALVLMLGITACDDNSKTDQHDGVEEID